MSAGAWAETADGLSLSVRLTPKGGRDAIDGIIALSDGRQVLKARVRAAPEDGLANAGLIALMAAELDVPRSSITLAAGHTARLKTLRITGDGSRIAQRLSSIIASKRD
ncbi:DUF167 family protein [Terrihabitans sp. B22-R8]|uniref:DUF167 family protein n=1 Tax=Terrihabitans sp. B22-R8 TaxID=3425128 RepID=UPI00403D2AA7